MQIGKNFCVLKVSSWRRKSNHCKRTICSFVGKFARASITLWFVLSFICLPVSVRSSVYPSSSDDLLFVRLLSSFVRSFIRLFMFVTIYSFGCSSVHSFVGSLVCSFFLLFVCLCVHSVVGSFVRSFVQCVDHKDKQQLFSALAAAAR